MRGAQHATVLCGDAYGIAGLGFAGAEDIAAEDPGVAARYASYSFAVNGDSRQAMARSRAMRSSVLG